MMSSFASPDLHRGGEDGGEILPWKTVGKDDARLGPDAQLRRSAFGTASRFRLVIACWWLLLEAKELEKTTNRCLSFNKEPVDYREFPKHLLDVNDEDLFVSF